MRVAGLDPVRQGAQLRRRVGVQLQNAALPDRLKVWEALDLYAVLHGDRADWHPLLGQWGLLDKRNAAFGELSGGQRQRLFIALALVGAPEVVVLDELTGGLDPQARRAGLVRQIREPGTTVVLVTRFMEEAERLCDRVAILDQGRLVALDSPHALVRRLPTGTRVRFGTFDGFDPSWLDTLPWVRSVGVAGDQVEVAGDGPVLARVAGALAERSVEPGDLRVQYPSLEDVFLTLTGKQIQE